jgi:alkylation response protein AidB-like acyl-CoA dehydrogenase
MKDAIARAEALEPIVRQYADEADQERRLPAPVAKSFAEQGLYRLGAPKDFAGEEADPMTQMAAIETISRFDGSAGWNLMIGIETFGLVAPGLSACRELIEDPMVVMCGSTAAIGRAEKDGEGYRVNGQWQFVSGCHNSTIFGATVRLYDKGEPVGTPVYALIAAPDFKILDTWHVGGMRGSGSHDVTVSDIWIPAKNIAAPIGGVKSDHPLMRFPTGARLAFNKVAVSLGLARAGLDAFIDLAQGKTPRFTSKKLQQRPAAHRAIAEAEARYNGCRASVYGLTEAMWRKILAGHQVTPQERAIYQIACSDAARGCVEAVEWVAEAAGTTANQIGHPLERINRDVRVVRQHLTVASHHMDDGGRVLLGLEPQEMMLKNL